MVFDLSHEIHVEMILCGRAYRVPSMSLSSGGVSFLGSQRALEWQESAEVFLLGGFESQTKINKLRLNSYIVYFGEKQAATDALITFKLSVHETDRTVSSLNFTFCGVLLSMCDLLV